MVFQPGRKGGKETTGIVPDTWILDNFRCLWPPFRKQKQIDEAVMNRAQPGDNWSVCAMRFLRSSGKLFVICVPLSVSGTLLMQELSVCLLGLYRISAPANEVFSAKVGVTIFFIRNQIHHPGCHPTCKIWCRSD